MMFNSTVLTAMAAALPAATKSMPLLICVLVFVAIFGWRLIGSLTAHVRNQMLEEAIFEPVSIEATQALLVQHSRSNAIQK